jgi:YHS domain-containing protein
MDGLFSLLIFAGLFYFMMRFGCGAHMIHGNHNHGTEKNKIDKNNPDHVDLVCGMKVDPDKGYGMMYEGLLHRFCSRNCLDKFEASPQSFIHSQQHGESS